MYSFAGSFNVNMIADPLWQQAMEKSALCNIEISTSQRPEDELAKQVAADVLRLQKAGSVRAASLHLPFGAEINFSSDNEEMRRASVLGAISYINIFRELDIHNITIHCSGERDMNPDRKVHLQAMRRSCEEFLPLMQEMQCSLNLEFLPRICIGNTFEELAEMTRDFPVENIGICLDVNHGMNRGETIPAMIRACGDRLKTLHLSDYDNIDECHWNIGEGMLDWVEIQKSVAAMPQELLLIVETKVLAIAAWKGYTPDPRFEVQNVERNCMKFEFAAEQQQLMEKIRAAGFTGGRC